MKWNLLVGILMGTLLLVGCQNYSTTTANNAEEDSQTNILQNEDTTEDVEKQQEKAEIKIESYKKVMAVKTTLATVREAAGEDQEQTNELKKETPVDVFEKADLDGETWYHIHYDGDKEGWIIANDVEVPASKQLDITLVNQLPELPNGCEVTSLTMLLQSAGIDVDKMTLADKMKKVPFEKDGLHGDPNDGFVGNMYHGPPGYSVYHGPVFALAKEYLKDRAVDLTGKDWDEVENQLIKEKPVWVIVNVQFRKLADSYWEDWKTKNGTIKVTMQEHSVLVTGYDKENVYFNDPLAGIKNRKAKKSDFIEAWQQMGSQAISY